MYVVAVVKYYTSLRFTICNIIQIKSFDWQKLDQNKESIMSATQLWFDSL